MFPFYAVRFSMAVTGLNSAAQSLSLAAAGKYPVIAAWQEADNALARTVEACEGTPLAKWLVNSLRVERIKPRIGVDHLMAVGSSLMELDADLRLEVLKYQALLIPPERVTDYLNPIFRFAKSMEKFPSATPEMASAVRTFALDEWDSSVFHAMRVLEHGLRWLAGQFPNLTLRKPVELENWESIIGNIQARIDEELKRNAPRTTQRDSDLAFYGKAAAEFRYFKDAWRNHVMHSRNDPYDEYEAGRVLEHVATFMAILAERA